MEQASLSPARAAAGASRGAMPATWWLAALVALAAALRLAWAWKFGLAIENEGVEYARIGENLLRGRGFVGIFNNGVQLNFPPLYPIAIAALSLVTGSSEWAARLICIFAGALLVVPMARFADWIHGRRVAQVVAAMVALHPMLIAGSASTYSEGPYLTLMLFALYETARWVATRRLRHALVAGLLMGLSYLIRPEAFLFVFLIVGGALAAGLLRPAHRDLWKGGAGLLLVFALLALPNIAFLTVHTGKVRIEAKGTLAYQWGQRINQGMSYPEAANGIGPDLSEQGVFMRPYVDVITSARFTTGEYLRFALEAAKKNVGPLLKTFSGSATMGAPWLLLLAVLGLFRSAWTRQRALLDGLLVATASIFILTLVSVQAVWLRYFYASFGLLLFWAANGLCELRTWAEDTLKAWPLGERLPRLAGNALLAVGAALVLLTSLRAVPYESQFAEASYHDRRDAGLWLAQHEKAADKWVMDAGVQVPFYAGAHLMYLPYADSDLALRYIAKKKPDYIVLVGGSSGALPYPQQWFEKGIPDARAELIYDRAGAEHVKIYRWRSGSGS